MFSRFFIDRPVFASVVSLLIFIAGLVAALQLPVAQFPDIVPPSVSVSANYAGADAQTLVDTVAVPIEQQMNGVDNMIYMTSTCSNNGTYTLNVYFEIGTDPDINTVNVNNRVSQANPRLPDVVKQVGVTVKKTSPSILGFYSFSMNDQAGPTKDLEYLANYVSIHVKDEIARTPGVGQATVMDAKDFSIRIWLDPRVLAGRNLSVRDIAQVIQEQNVQVASGSIGAEPAPEGQLQTITITTKGRLREVDEFENLVVRTDQDGSVLKLKDVARVELARETYAMRSYNKIFPPSEEEKEALRKENPELRGVALEDRYRPATTMAVYLMPGANAMEVARAVNAKLEKMRPDLERSGIDFVCAYDSTVFISVSLEEVAFTLFLTILIVIGVVYVFLQDWRAAVIPTLTIPVSLVGTFFMMAMFGFSINTLTLFGLILVIGIVVDDAILVVENCTRLMDDEGLSPRDAAVKSMQQVSGPIVATTCVLLSVFLPTTFISGMVGILYQQFALTIAGSVVLSAVCALTLSPAMCAIVLRPSIPEEKKFFFFRWFNLGFNGFAAWYERNLKFFIANPCIVLLFWVFLIAAVYYGFMVIQSGFIPNEDQGVVYVDVRLPDGASLARTDETCRQVNAVLERDFNDAIKNVHFMPGYSMLDGVTATNVGLGVINLRDWKERKSPELYAEAVANRIMRVMNREIPGAFTIAFVSPAIQGIGTSGGIEAQLIDTNETGVGTLHESAQAMMRMAEGSENFSRISSTFSPTYPMYHLVIDREKVKNMGINLTEVFATLQTYLGSDYVNDFNAFSRVFKVMVQAQDVSRHHYRDILQLPVMNGDGTHVPLGTFATVKEVTGPAFVNRYNLYTTTQLTTTLNATGSTGNGMKELVGMTERLPEGFSLEWTGLAFQQARAGTAIAVIFVLSMVFGFLVLAAQYESWSAPIIIMMAVPLGVSGAMLAVWLAGLDINLYTQIGLILMVGLSAKNAILITEYARDEHLKEHHSVRHSAALAGRLRLRPIMMTSYAFIFGVVPLMIATGAGANSRRAIGTAVFGGMLEETMIGVLVTPVLFILITNMGEFSMRHIRRWVGLPACEVPVRELDS
ncbi:MAG: efflux RND transporter permease subunit [Planctomycetia bacterium]|nr:efflux RND transporter permease subunit [Planctomycetia bacterium]